MRSPAGESASKSSTQVKALTRYVAPSAASGEATDDSFFAQIWYITSATTIRTTGHHRASMEILLSKKRRSSHSLPAAPYLRRMTETPVCSTRWRSSGFVCLIALYHASLSSVKEIDWNRHSSAVLFLHRTYRDIRFCHPVIYAVTYRCSIDLTTGLQYTYKVDS